MIIWKETYSTGIEKLDNQHKSLFDYCNDLEAGLKGDGVTKGTLELALRFLERYIVVHFGQEETCMFKHACPVANTNKAAHQEFIENYEILKKKVIESDNVEQLVRELHSFLETWLVEHICKIDTKLKPCVK